MEDRQYYGYILSSGMYGTLYVGVTNDLIRRVWEHRNDIVQGFTREYGVHQLVWYKVHGSVIDHARKTDQEMESRLESQPHPSIESVLG